MNLCKLNPQTHVCGFQCADYTYNLRVSLTDADSATAHFNYMNVFFFCLWILQTVPDCIKNVLQTARIVLVLSHTNNKRKVSNLYILAKTFTAE